jgi:hypothetical protein
VADFFHAGTVFLRHLHMPFFTGMAPAACIWPGSRATMTAGQALSRPVTPRMTSTLFSARLARWMVLQASSSAAKDAARPPREEVAVLRRHNFGPSWTGSAVR